MNDSFKKALPLLMGSAIAAILFVFPEAKPLACGLGFALPYVAGGN